MKKIVLLLISIIIISTSAQAQINWGAYSQSYPSGVTDKASNIGIIATIPEINNCFWRSNPNEVLRSILANDSAFQHNRPKEFVAINSFDTAKAQFFLHGINKINAGGYEYRVTYGKNKIIVPWSSITHFTDKALIKLSGMPQMAYLGGYAAALGDKIIVDVKKAGGTNIISTAVVAWVPIKPVLSDIYSANELNIFLNRLSRPWSNSNYKSQYPVNRIDKVTGLPQKFITEPIDNNLIFYLDAEIYKKEQLEYELIKDGGVFIAWKTNDFDNDFVWLKNLKPGEYLLKMRYTAQREHMTEYPFKIKTPWYESIWFKIIAGILSCASLGFVLFFILHIKQQQKAEEELAKKTKIQLELKAIYAQLNPHFIFNALSSIQGLINKQDIKGANTYLSDFAGLLRESLNNSNKEQVALRQEIAALDTYLKLEQLRFGFNYAINVAENINSYETEIPSLLLQPLIENAVKHGISALQEKGNVALSFTREQNNMMVTIKDNGSGFRQSENNNGFGLKLTRDRIKLLNEFSNEEIIRFEIKSGAGSGTVATLTFKNWFL
jgi:two-component system LytT family sensor kinase